MFEAEAKMMLWLPLFAILLGLLTGLFVPRIIGSHTEAIAAATAAHRTPTATPGSN